MLSMNKARKFLRELHEDESGPNTVEWILLIIIALILVVVIYIFANWAIEKFQNKADQVQTDTFIQ